jgi:KRAB domain-containing zinc finger protein
MSAETILEGNFDFILDELVEEIQHHQCHLCQAEFLMKTDFKAHLKHHGRQKYFNCPKCLHLYPSSTKLWSHLSKTHLKKEATVIAKTDLSCSLCDNKIFKQAFNYHLHMLIHLEEQPEKCRYCPKTFRTKPSLRKHELIHTGHKPFECLECKARLVKTPSG